MGMNGSEIKQILVEENVDFKRLYEEHKSYDERLNQMQAHPHLTTEEEIEILQIKKLKLSLKDQMQQFVEHFKGTH